MFSFSVLAMNVYAQEPGRNVSQAGQQAESPADSLAEAPVFNLDYVPLLPRLYYPDPYYMSGWQLHEGFNAQLGMYVTAGFGKHSPKGVGFGTSAAFLWAEPISRRLSLAGGIMTNTLDWGGFKMRNASLLGIAAYRLNDFMNFYAFGQKDLMPRGKRFRNYPSFGEDRWGGAVDFSLGNHVFIQVGVSQSRYNY